MKQKIENIVTLIVVIAICVGMFLWGRSTVHIPEPGQVSSDTVYVDLPAVHDTLKLPGEIKYLPADTVKIPIPQPTDTAALFAVWLDYYATREYDLDFSSDTLGVFKVGAKVTENKLVEATSTVQPRMKVVTTTEVIYKERFLQPWVMLGTSFDFKFQELQAGVDLNNRWMLGVSGVRYKDALGGAINIGIKF